MPPTLPDGITLEHVGPDNLADCGIGCLQNPRHEGHAPKVAWLEERFPEGLRFFLFRDESGKPLGFLEYVPGERAWRPVDAEGWLFVHCLWVYASGKKIGGLGSRLIQAAVDEGVRQGKAGVSALVSDGPWMAGASVFLRNGFEVMEERDRFALVARRTGSGRDPAFKDLPKTTTFQEGLHVVYSPQCPMLPKSVNDLAVVAAEYGLDLNTTEIRSAEEAQAAPSYYGVFNLVWNGQLISDHYVSKGRFKNILKKGILG